MVCCNFHSRMTLLRIPDFSKVSLIPRGVQTTLATIVVRAHFSIASQCVRRNKGIKDMKEYKIVTGEVETAFNAAVSTLLKSGWTLVGGVSTTVKPNGVVFFAQSLAK
ncbi:DUF1737 domain-containing protein [Acetobacter cerevisiae]|uniref:DUF1737 domain-containing protein n=1 Tax=Acetobacter cerevisiae TaxID=178900 RepID=UPI0009EEC7E3